MPRERDVSEALAVLEKLLSDNPGPVSTVAGLAALRAIGPSESADELQSMVGTYAAERHRPIRFDRFTDAPEPIDCFGADLARFYSEVVGTAAKGLAYQAERAGSFPLPAPVRARVKP